MKEFSEIIKNEKEKKKTAHNKRHEPKMKKTEKILKEMMEIGKKERFIIIFVSFFFLLFWVKTLWKELPDDWKWTWIRNSTRLIVHCMANIEASGCRQ